MVTRTLAELFRRGRAPEPLRCGHHDAVAVESLGELVAGLCPACGDQLPAEWLTCSHERAEVLEWDKHENLGPGTELFETMYPGRKRCRACGSTWREPVEMIWIGSL